MYLVAGCQTVIEGKQIVLCSHFFVLGELMNAMFYKLLKSSIYLGYVLLSLLYL